MLLKLRRVSYFAAIFALVLLVQACNRNLSDADLAKIKAMVQTKSASIGPGGASGDEDAPLTMAGGSLSITLWGTISWIFDSENKFLHPDSTRIVKEVEFWNGDKDPVPFKRNAEAWKIVVDYMKGTNDRPVEFDTDAMGQNLSVSSDSKAKLFTFRRVGNYLLEHPRKAANVTSIQFVTGTNRSMAIATAAGCGFPGGVIKCDCASGGDCGIVIHYCLNTASSTACM